MDSGTTFSFHGSMPTSKNLTTFLDSLAARLGGIEVAPGERWTATSLLCEVEEETSSTDPRLFLRVDIAMTAYIEIPQKPPNEDFFDIPGMKASGWIPSGHWSDLF